MGVGSFVHEGAEADQVAVRVGVRALAELVGGRGDRVRVPAYAGPAPLFVEGVGVAHVQIRRCAVVRGIVAVVGCQVQAGSFAVGEPVLVAGRASA